MTRTIISWARNAKDWREWLDGSMNIVGILDNAAESFLHGSWAGSIAQSCYRIQCQGGAGYEVLVLPDFTDVMMCRVKFGDLISVICTPNGIVVEVYRERRKRGNFWNFFRRTVERQVVHRYEASREQLESKVITG